MPDPAQRVRTRPAHADLTASAMQNQGAVQSTAMVGQVTSGVRLVDGCIVRPVVVREDSPVSLRSRVVQGFGSERCDDVAADRARLDAEQLARQIHRVQEGERGRMTDRTGEDLDRSAGSAWKAGGR